MWTSKILRSVVITSAHELEFFVLTLSFSFLVLSRTFLLFSRTFLSAFSIYFIFTVGINTKKLDFLGGRSCRRFLDFSEGQREYY